MIFISNNHLQFEPRGHNKIKKSIESISNHTCEAGHFLEVSIDGLKKLKPQALILSGFPGHLQARQVGDFDKELEIIREVMFPILGICGGHQLIGLAFGAEVAAMQTEEKGMREVEIVKPDPLFEGLPNRIIVRESHLDEVVNLPAGFELLASNEYCQIQAMRHKEKKIYGLQFHPEYFNKAHPDGRQVLANFISIIEEKA